MWRYWFVVDPQPWGIQPKPTIRAVELIWETRIRSGKWTHLCTQDWCLTLFSWLTAPSCFWMDAKEGLLDIIIEITIQPWTRSFTTRMSRWESVGSKNLPTLISLECIIQWPSVCLMAGYGLLVPITMIALIYPLPTPRNSEWNISLLHTYSNHRLDLSLPMCQKSWCMTKSIL